MDAPAFFSPYEEQPLAFAPHDRLAAEVGRHLALLLARFLPETEVEHVGSTAVPGLGGKNSINLLIAAPEEFFPDILNALEAMGMAEHPQKQEPADRPVRVGSIAGQERRYPVHVKVVAKGSPNHYNSVFMREYLRGNPEAADAYAEVKRRLVESGGSEEEYGIAKQPHILDIIARRPESWKKPGDPLA